MQPTHHKLSTDPLAQRAAQDAARWLATLSDEHCGEAERDQFFQWLRSSTQHVDEFLRVSSLARCASRRELWADDSVDSLIAAARADSNVLTLDAEAQPTPVHRTPVRWAIAASLASVIAVGALMTTRFIDLDPVYITAVGEQRSITLEDGSVVQLNSQSRLRARFLEELRAVELSQGEAIFRVAKDPDRPFRVRTGLTDIVAIGTAFNVNASSAKTIVTVLEGRVRVSRGDAASGRSGQAPQSIEHIELAMGEQLIVAPRLPAIRVALRDTEKVTSWTERRLIFENTEIAAAAAEFARYSSRQIRIDDPQLAARQITGVFDATDPASLVQFLETDATVEVQADGGGWVVKTKNQN
ncbi:MAG: FecR family protein [Steroidobacter sp.]